MKFLSLSLTGDFQHAAEEVEAEIHKLFEEFSEKLKGHNVTHSGSLNTDEKGTTVTFTAVAPAAPVGAAAAPVAEPAPAVDPAPAPEPVPVSTTVPEAPAAASTAGADAGAEAGHNG